MLQVSVERALQLQGGMTGLEISLAKVGVATCSSSQELVNEDRAMPNRNPANTDLQ